MSLLIQMAMQTVVRVADLLRFEIHLRQIPVLLFTEPLVPVLKLAAAGIVPPVDSSLKDDTSPPPCRFHGLRPFNQRGRRTSGNIHQNHVNLNFYRVPTRRLKLRFACDLSPSLRQFQLESMISTSSCKSNSQLLV
uniref:Uncharacterized protein n=1 Tax=Populus alba TaxID=43335 RepID=A0A4U5QN03_POPAL|nr:hypothetical protein D5086_0000071440 [Populus alba]